MTDKDALEKFTNIVDHEYIKDLFLKRGLSYDASKELRNENGIEYALVTFTWTEKGDRKSSYYFHGVDRGFLRRLPQEVIMVDIVAGLKYRFYCIDMERQ